MDFKDKGRIVDKFNKAVEQVAEIIKANIAESDGADVHDKDVAASSLAAACEWAVKYHLFHHAENITQSWKDNDFFIPNAPPSIKDLDNAIRDASKGRPFTNRILPDFDKLSLHKRFARNSFDHGGKEPYDPNELSRLNLTNTRDLEFSEHSDFIGYVEEARRLILAYVDENAELHKVEDYLEFSGTNWENLYAACNGFERDDNNYILLVGSMQAQPLPYKKYLGSLPWNLVLDFDRFSMEEGGFFHSCYSEEAIQPYVIKINDRLTDTDLPASPKSHYHLFIKGFIGDGLNINSEITWREWSPNFRSQFFARQLSAFGKKYSSPAKILILHDDERFVDGICTELNTVFADRADFILLSPNERLLDRLEDYDVKCIPLSLSELAVGISLRQHEFGTQNFLEGTILLPHNKHTKTPNVDGLFNFSELARLEEDLEVLYLGIEKKGEIEDRLDFLSGRKPLSWYGVSQKNPFDVPHPKFKSVLKNIENQDRDGIYYLKHEPGVGGTTFARRIAWALHDGNPTVILKKYRTDELIVQRLREIYEKTRQRVYIITSVPQAIPIDDLAELNKRLKAESWPYTLIAVGRELPQSNSTLTDWADDCSRLVEEFKQVIQQKNYASAVLERKRNLLNGIINSNRRHEKTPFYIGFSALEEDFYGTEDFVSGFIAGLTEEKRKVLLYISLIQEYLGEMLPAYFFSRLLKQVGNQPIKIREFLGKSFDHILRYESINGVSSCSTIHISIAREFKKQLLQKRDTQGDWKANLPTLCINFIEDSHLIGEQSNYIQESILQPLFIGSRAQRGGEAFTALVNAISSDAREAVFVKLTTTFPNNPHYCSHLARFYAYTMPNMELALKYATDAIELSEKEDAILYHIRGICYRQAAILKIDNIKSNGSSYFEEEVKQILFSLIPNAGREFQKAREIQKSSEYGYVSHIQMLIAGIDFGWFLFKENRPEKTKADFLSTEQEPYAEWLDQAATLLEEVKRLTANEENTENERISRCDNDLNTFYEKYSLVIQNLDNQLKRSKNPERVRRQLARFIIKNKPGYATDTKTVNRVMELMAENIADEPEKERNFYLWFQAARYSSLSIIEAMDKMSQWKANSNTLDAAFYFYVLKVIRAIDGYSPDMADAVKLIQESKQKSRNLPNNRYCHEWYGINREMGRIVSGREVSGGNWEGRCELLRGKITEFTDDGTGKITLKEAELLEIFFRPSENKISEDRLNEEVEFYLGFSYDGLRAKNVQLYNPANRTKIFLGQSTAKIQDTAKVVSIKKPTNTQKS